MADEDLSIDMILEYYRGKLQAGEEIDGMEFELKMRKAIGANWQGIKPIILHFYEDPLWKDVCEAYARAFPCVEFHKILRKKVK